MYDLLMHLEKLKKAISYLRPSQGKTIVFAKDKVYIFLTHYEDKGSAIIHKEALKNDKYAALLDLENEKHRQKLNSMLSPDSNYILYSSLITKPEIVEETLNKSLSQNMKRYIQRQTNWQIARDQTIHPKMELIFGELFLRIKYGSQTIKVALTEIENA